MIAADILTLGLTMAHSSSSQISSTNQLIYLNSIYQDLVQAIIEFVGEDFFYEIWKRDAVADQTNGEYDLPEQDGTNPGMSKLKQLLLKISSTETYYTKARQVDLRSLAYGWDWYLANQPASDPIYRVADKSVFIAPNFTSATTGVDGNEQIELHGMKEAIDLTSSDVEDEILIPREYHASVMAVGMKQYIYAELGKTEEAQAAEAEYARAKSNMLSMLTDRDVSIGVASVPDEALLE